MHTDMFFRAEQQALGVELSKFDSYWLKLCSFARACIFYSTIAITCALSSCMILLLVALGLRKQAIQVNRSWAGLFLEAGRLICGLDYQIKGFETVPAEACVFLVRHESAWETIALQYFLPDSIIIFKRSLLWVPFFGLNLLVLRFIPVVRERCIQAFKVVLRQGLKQLQNGTSVVFFPEGTRVTPSAFPTFYRAGAHLAKTAKVTVVPISHNAGDCWGRNQFVKRPGTIQLIVGPALAADDTVSVNQLAHEWIKTTRLNMNSPPPL